MHGGSVIGLLRLLPGWAYGVISLALAGALAASHRYAYEAGADNREAHVQNKYLKDYTESLQAARDKEQSLQAKARKAEHDFSTRKNRILADAAASRRESDGLRNELASIRTSLPAQSLAASRGIADALAELFGACTERYLRVAEQADALQNERDTLIQAWPK
jgi:hypothetical protein